MSERLAVTRRVRVTASVEELLAEATQREAWKNSDSLSGSRLERVTIAGEAFVVKYTCVDDDWIMRATGDLHCRQLTLFASDVLDSLPHVIDHTIVACAPYFSARGHRGAAFLMRDVSADLVPEGSAAIDLELHRRFLSHMAQMHAAYIDFTDGADLFPLAHHYVSLTPTMAALEAARGGMDPVPPAVAAGWSAMQSQHPREARTLLDLAVDPSPLVGALAVGRQTLIHSDWKLGNLGSTPDATRPARLGPLRRGTADRRPGVVSRRELRPAAGDQRGNHRGLSHRSCIRGYRHLGVVGTTASCSPGRRFPPARLVQERRPRRIRVVERSARRGPAPSVNEPG